MAYWDTSCLLKLYTPEPYSAEVTAYARKAATLVTSEIARLELWAALRRKESLGDLRAGGGRGALDAFDADVRAGIITLRESTRP